MIDLVRDALVTFGAPAVAAAALYAGIMLGLVSWDIWRSGPAVNTAARAAEERRHVELLAAARRVAQRPSSPRRPVPVVVPVLVLALVVAGVRAARRWAR